jgi:hypothetical protein
MVAMRASRIMSHGIIGSRAINAYGIATGGGTLAYQMLAPTAAKADKMVEERLAAPVTADATTSSINGRPRTTIILPLPLK